VNRLSVKVSAPRMDGLSGGSGNVSIVLPRWQAQRVGGEYFSSLLRAANLSKTRNRGKRTSMSQQALALLLTAVGAGLAFVFTYVCVRRVLFRDQELQEVVEFSKGVPEARSRFSDEELEEAARVHSQATFMITVALAVIGWVMCVVKDS
jgi:hypothetical protein